MSVSTLTVCTANLCRSLLERVPVVLAVTSGATSAASSGVVPVLSPGRPG